jgi:hypothetical protein
MTIINQQHISCWLSKLIHVNLELPPHHPEISSSRVQKKKKSSKFFVLLARENLQIACEISPIRISNQAPAPSKGICNTHCFALV